MQFTNTPLNLIAVCGPGTIVNPELASLAEQIGREIAKAGWGVVCGGLDGVMSATCRGARAEGGFTVGILPGTDRMVANPYISLPICTGINEARNLVVVATGQVVIAVGGEWGTLSEIALARKIGRQVVLIAGQGWNIQRADENSVTGIAIAQTPAEAVALAIQLTKI